MTGRQTLHVASVVVALAMVAAAIGISGTSAQTRRLSEPSAKTASATAAWRDCGAATASAPREAIAKATELLGQFWLVTERGYFAAYTMVGEVRNPFDLSPRLPDSGPRDGVIQARPPVCAWQTVDASDGIEVRFTTAFYRFHEAGHGWSAPLRNGLMLEARIGRTGATWQARDTSGERGILLPEQKPRAADPTALPADAAWAEPLPGCARKTKWNGEACVARKR